MSNKYPVFLARFMINDLTGIAKKYKLSLSEVCRWDKNNIISDIIYQIYDHQITRYTGKQEIEKIIKEIK